VRIACCGVLLCLLPGLLLAQETRPEAPRSSAAPVSEQRLRAWLEAFNSQDETTYRSFVTEYAPAIEKYVRDDHRYAVSLDGFQLEALTAATPAEAQATLRDPWSDATTSLTIKIEPQPPHRILAADLGRPQVEAARIVPFANESELVVALRRRLERQAAAGRFSGVVLVARGPRLLFEGAYGAAARSRARCAPGELRFNLASMGKMLTATAVLQLAEAGQVELDAPLLRYLPDYANRELAGAVTLRQLLNHTGGTGDIFVKEVAAKRDSLASLQDYIDLLQARPAEYPPGTRWAYSNYGFVLLGRVIERVTGTDYLSHVAQRVLPAAAANGACAKELPGLTRGDDGIEWIERSRGLERQPTSAGGFAASVRQLWGFARGLLEDELVSAASRRLLFTGTVEIPGGKYALGFKDLQRDGLRYVGHGGSAPGINDALEIYPDSGYIVIVLTNQDPPYGNRIADFIGYRMRKLAAADRHAQPAGSP
jgi:D-alanyl-D-alanine carboxypeptidase